MKPSEELQEFWKINMERYKDFDKDSRYIASLSNMITKIGEILDRLSNN